jgi:hypothetical protein
MRPIRWGLAAALVAVILAPVAVYSATRAPEVSREARQQGMKDAPAVVQAAGLGCQVSDARLIGKGSDAKTHAAIAEYEVACGQGMGYVIIDTAKQAPTILSCAEVAPAPDQKPQEGALACILPANANPAAALQPILAKAGASCTPDRVRGIGQSKDGKSFVEVSCQGGQGYILVGSTPMDTSKPVEAQSCLLSDDEPGAIKCTLTTKDQHLAIVNTLTQESGKPCTVKDRRFVGMTTDHSEFYETSCQDGSGYMLKSTNGKLAQAWSCAQAAQILGGCTLTDARQAMAEQAATYTKLAHNAGSQCNVDSYATIGMRANDEVVELVCKGAPGAIGVFPPTGAGVVTDCAHAVVFGVKCALNKEAGFAALTKDLRSFDQKTCEVSEARYMGQTEKGTQFVEVACADKLKGYVVEYATKPQVHALGAKGCAFAGGCKLPGNV